MADLEKIYAPKGLVLISPTKLYGYVAGGEPAAPADEKRYIETVRRQYYAGLSGTPVPLDAANFLNYGASTTPTLVLIDRNGVVRYYHPGAVGTGAGSSNSSAAGGAGRSLGGLFFQYFKLLPATIVIRQ